MNLRNKKTGEILDITLIANQGYLAEHEVKTYYDEPISLKVLERYFEDYTPAEPLIKDEKIRKAVRAWAELHKIEIVFYFSYAIHKELAFLKDKDAVVVIDIGALPELEDGEIYTIAELCGEGE